MIVKTAMIASRTHAIARAAHFVVIKTLVVQMQGIKQGGIHWTSPASADDVSLRKGLEGADHLHDEVKRDDRGQRGSTVMEKNCCTLFAPSTLAAS